MHVCKIGITWKRIIHSDTSSYAAFFWENAFGKMLIFAASKDFRSLISVLVSIVWSCWTPRSLWTASCFPAPCEGFPAHPKLHLQEEFSNWKSKQKVLYHTQICCWVSAELFPVSSQFNLNSSFQLYPWIKETQLVNTASQPDAVFWKD